MASDLTTVAFIYKTNYSQKQVEDLTTRDHVWYTMMPKEGGFVGANFAYTIRSGNPQGIGGTFAGAQTAAETSKGLLFTATRQSKFADIVIDGEAAAASRGDRGAFFDLVTMETDNVLVEFGDALAFDFYRDKSGVRGQRASIAGNVVTLVDTNDARNFKEGMTVGASTGADGITGLRAGTTKVAGVDEITGTVTLVNAGAITSFANSDFMFRATEPGTCIEGMEVCTPLTAPVGGDSFRGKDRSSNVTRYAGSRVNDTSTTIEENLGLVATFISRAGRSHNVDQAFLNPVRLWEVVRRQGAKVEYEQGGQFVYGFQYAMIDTPAGRMKVYSDPDCPMNRGRVSRAGSQYIKTLEGYPHIWEEDGLPSLRQSSAMAIEARGVSWGNLVQVDPVAQGVIAI